MYPVFNPPWRYIYFTTRFLNSSLTYTGLHLYVANYLFHACNWITMLKMTYAIISLSHWMYHEDYGIVWNNTRHTIHIKVTATHVNYYYMKLKIFRHFPRNMILLWWLSRTMVYQCDERTFKTYYHFELLFTNTYPSVKYQIICLNFNKKRFFRMISILHITEINSECIRSITFVIIRIIHQLNYRELIFRFHWVFIIIII